MFNDKYGLTRAVIDEKKTQTRRLVGSGKIYDSSTNSMYRGELSDAFKDMLIRKFSRYSLNEEIAVAQSYGNCGTWFFPVAEYGNEAGYTNKMFVKAEYMPYRIKITNIRVEHLQDITYEDCLKEGLYAEQRPAYITYGYRDSKYNFKMLSAKNPIPAFAALTDKIYGKGTWDSNPFVFVYDFKIVK